MGKRQYLAAMKASHPTRILTCCYCGARSTLPREGHAALVCHGCGAAITKIETLQPAIERLPKRKDSGRPATPHPADKPDGHKPHDRPARRRKGKRRKDSHDAYRPQKRKRRKSLWSRLEDQFEDVLDIFDLD